MRYVSKITKAKGYKNHAAQKKTTGNLFLQKQLLRGKSVVIR